MNKLPVTNIYFVRHTYLSIGQAEQAKRIGFFLSQSEAMKTINVLRNAEGFSDHKDGFSILVLEVDKLYLEEIVG
jgi:hypothetical protein